MAVAKKTETKIKAEGVEGPARPKATLTAAVKAPTPEAK